MRRQTTTLAGIILLAGSARLPAEPGLTIYNQDFAVVRDSLALDLKPGVNEIRCRDTTAHLEPDSVILRDPTGRCNLRILEQSYRADPISQELLLSLYEGKTIGFQVQQGAKTEVVQGKIVRSGYVPHWMGLRRYGREYSTRQMAYAEGPGGSSQPIIEVNGQLRFSLPGLPLFPSLTDDSILKPTLAWLIETDQAGKFDAELAYVTGGMSWEADYNVVAPEQGEQLDLTGWVTMDNQSGKSFPNARIKLMAGEVRKIREDDRGRGFMRDYSTSISGPQEGPPVSEKTFDEYHLYTLQRPTTLLDRQTKQVEFVRAAGVKAQRVYVYDGAKINNRYRNWSLENLRSEAQYGIESNPKVWVMREFKNSSDNHLGIPLPSGRLRFYRQDDDRQLEFIGESIIDHTPKDELIRVYTGNAFDLVGERRRVYFKVDTNRQWANESFEIKLRNHKKEAVEIRVTEHLYRWNNWEIVEKSHEYRKMDSQTIEFRVSVAADQELALTYKVHYSW